MKYKEAKKIVVDSFEADNMALDFGWKFKWYPSLRKQMKLWAKQTEEGEEEYDEEPSDIDYEQCDKCQWRISYGCSQQTRRPEKGDNCPTFEPKEPVGED